MILQRIASPLLRLIACVSLASAVLAAMWSIHVAGTTIAPVTLWPLALTLATLLADHRLCRRTEPPIRDPYQRRSL